nr:DUF4384 domain-containing protein [Desulfobulbaceae bacterium]
MNRNTFPWNHTLRSRFSSVSLFLFILSVFVGCNPHDVNVELPETAPVQQVTNYSQALADLGLMTEIFGTGIVRVQSEDIIDNTGTSSSTGGEIQRNITEIMKSTLNSMGGNVVFIEYNPAYIQNQMVTGYSQFDDKLIPDIVITGGITEFDRGLETRGEGTDASAEFNVSGLPSAVPSSKVGFEYGDSGKEGKARITLDFNMKDFKTLAGIARMNTVNSMEVHKAVREKEIGITLFGPTFGMKGSIKKVQGRHEAVRLLVQASMIQMLGKYLVLPYWKLLGDDAIPDPVVMEKLSRSWANMSELDRTVNVQEWLYLHGKDVTVNGVLDQNTITAIRQLNPAFAGSMIDQETFVKIYTAIPVNHTTLARRNALNQIYANASVQPQPTQPAPPPAAPKATATAQPAKQPETTAATQASAPRQPASQPAAARQDQSPKGIGRILSNDEW